MNQDVRIWTTGSDYYTEDQVYCDECGEETSEFFLMVTMWGKRQSRQKAYCKACFPKIKLLGIVQEHRVVMLEQPPEGCRPFLSRPPGLVACNNVSVFEPEKLQSEKTRDHCVLAGRESLEGAKIGDPRHITDDSALDRQITTDAEIDRILAYKPVEKQVIKR